MLKSQQPKPGSQGSKGNWILSRHIRQIPGALKPGAYLARAYLHEKSTGSFPRWAKKANAHDAKTGVRGVDWLFLESEIMRDAASNLKYITPGEIRKDIGVSRRTVLNWMDNGHLGKVVHTGAARERRALRSEYAKRRERLLLMLQDPATKATREFFKRRRIAPKGRGARKGGPLAAPVAPPSARPAAGLPPALPLAKEPGSVAQQSSAPPPKVALSNPAGRTPAGTGRRAWSDADGDEIPGSETKEINKALRSQTRQQVVRLEGLTPEQRLERVAAGLKDDITRGFAPGKAIDFFDRAIERNPEVPADFAKALRKKYFDK